MARIRTAWTASVTASTAARSRGRSSGSGGLPRRTRRSGRCEPEALEQRLDAAEQRTRRAREEQEPERRSSRRRRRLRARGMRSRRSARWRAGSRRLRAAPSPPRRARARARTVPVTIAVRPGWRRDGVDDSHRVAAERRRQELAGRVGDEVGAREPAQPLRMPWASRSQPQRAASTGTVHDHDQQPRARTRRGRTRRGCRASSRGRSSRRDRRRRRPSGAASRRPARGGSWAGRPAA